LLKNEQKISPKRTFGERGEGGEAGGS